MAKVPLRSYNHDIERLIDQGQCEEAIAHCRHILESFPKHLETYRLLGKAYLESQRYGEAADIFLRVLSSIPDDFISNIGMSIIREDEGNLESAIWHMERANEAQPANSAIQDELRRLIGRRDKVEPSRVRLTRAALVRMYVRGDLYQQAIAEARVAISEEPQRADLQILLAKMCYLAGQRVEATDHCSNLLNKYPYCYEANQILAEILPEIKRTEDAQIYRMRINSLDPYAAFVSQDIPTPLDVPETAIMLDELVWHPAPPATEQPQWAATLGINVFNQPGSSEKIPEWFNEPNTPAQTSQPTPQDLVNSGEATQTPEPEIQETIAQLDQSVLPDWMKNAGFEVTTVTNEVPPPEIQEAIPDVADESEVDLPKANLPDWIKELAPQPQAEEQGFVETESFENLFASSAALPDLTQTEDEVELSVNENIPNPPLAQDIFASEASADISTGSQSQLSQPAIEDQDSALAWLEGLAAKHGADDGTLFVKPEDRTDTPPAWIVESALQTSPAKVDENAPYAAQSPLSTSAIDGFEQAETDFSVKQGAEEDSLLSKPEEGYEPLPTWVQEFDSKNIETILEPSAIEESILPQTVSGASELAQQLPTEELPKPDSELSISDQDSAFAWLESLAAKHGADDGTLLVNPDDRSETLPDWIQKASTTPESLPLPSISEETPEENIIQGLDLTAFQPVEVTPELPPETSVPTQDNQAEAFAWLESLAAKQGADEEGLSIKPEDRRDSPPEWIVEAAAEPLTNQVSSPQPETTQTPVPDEIPDWLQNIELPQDMRAETQNIEIPQPAENPIAPISEDVPTWIQELQASPVEQQEIPNPPTPSVEESPVSKVEEDSEWLHSLKSSETEELLPPKTPEPESTDFTWLQNLEQTDQVTLPEETQRIVLPRSQPISKEVEMIPLAAPYVTPAPPAPSTGSEQNRKILKEAQYNLSGGKIDLALKGYYLLIESNQFLDETIHDLRDALYQFPVEINLWQALGDAYVRSNRLQDALDAYTQAEDLIK